MRDRRRKTLSLPRLAADGFTLVELIASLVIIGILGAVMAPRFFGKHGFEERGFHDETIAILRYAQKSAIAHHRLVCAAFTAKTVVLTEAANFGSANCTVNLTGPDGKAPYTLSADSDTKYRNADVKFSTFPPSVTFDALGRPNAATTIQVDAHPLSITVEADTGYVH